MDATKGARPAGIRFCSRAIEISSPGSGFDGQSTCDSVNDMVEGRFVATAPVVATVFKWLLRITEGDLVKLDCRGLELFRARERRHVDCVEIESVGQSASGREQSTL